ncbi:glucose dehydrogenase [FAD, quinone]-like [Centruroides vittatus]|uniref:glucose dehydrogenase [FAD, quinone]-like n=1 Tax=Centruroides vittatus TaxID=120091 RepID=UPI00350FC29C
MENYRWHVFILLFIFFRPNLSASEYDYIIVGAGSSGATVANRLSEDKFNNVLLLEAGDIPSLMNEIPALAENLQHSRFDWQYKTVPQTHSFLGTKDKRSTWVRGKALGGSSSINNMFYLRGNKKDYDEWAKAGATGWSWKEVLPYFLKSEGNTDPNFFNKEYHNSEGELTVSSVIPNNSITNAILEAGIQSGYDIVDFNGPKQTGFGLQQGTIRNGKRCSSETAFLRSAAGRPNLKIITKAFVTEILINSEKVATGVKFHYKNESRIVKVRKEIIISAGAINTPQLLMLSGIGPAEQLKSLAIPVVADLPVGHNLQDHIVAEVLFFSVNKTIEKTISEDDYLKFLINGTGPLATFKNALGMAYINSPLRSLQDDWPDVQLLFTNSRISTKKDGLKMKQALGLTDEVYKNVFDHYESIPNFMVSVALLRPYSRGYVTIKSKNPYEAPIINPRYLSHPKDIEMLVNGMKFAIKLSRTPALVKLKASLFSTIVPRCESFPHYSDPYLACAARVLSNTQNNPVGTCKMASRNDSTGVVDPELRVKGIKKLRVADASIMPTIPSGNTDVISVMIAEKASELIKRSHFNRPTKTRIPDPVIINRYIPAPIILLKQPFYWF